MLETFKGLCDKQFQILPSCLCSQLHLASAWGLSWSCLGAAVISLLFSCDLGVPVRVTLGVCIGDFVLFGIGVYWSSLWLLCWYSASALCDGHIWELPGFSMLVTWGFSQGSLCWLGLRISGDLFDSGHMGFCLSNLCWTVWRFAIVSFLVRLTNSWILCLSCWVSAGGPCSRSTGFPVLVMVHFFPLKFMCWSYLKPVYAFCLGHVGLIHGYLFLTFWVSVVILSS